MQEKLAAAVPARRRRPAWPPRKASSSARHWSRRLAECQTLDAVDAWRAASEEGIASLQDEDRTVLEEWVADAHRSVDRGRRDGGRMTSAIRPIFVKQRGRLVPAGAFDAERFDAFPEGTEFDLVPAPAAACRSNGHTGSRCTASSRRPIAGPTPSTSTTPCADPRLHPRPQGLVRRAISRARQHGI